MKKILFVDDEMDITDYAVIFLKSTGYDCVGAKNAKDAIKLLESFRPDMVILDISLREKVTGKDILKKALTINPGTRAIMLTGMVDDQTEKECLDLGAMRLVRKPILLNKLLEVIKEVEK